MFSSDTSNSRHTTDQDDDDDHHGNGQGNHLSNDQDNRPDDDIDGASSDSGGHDNGESKDGGDPSQCGNVLVDFAAPGSPFTDEDVRDLLLDSTSETTSTM